MRETAPLAAAALLSFAAPVSRAAEPTVEERLAELEKANVELLVSDRNTSRELERLRGAPSLVNQVEAEGDSADFGPRWRASGLLAYRFAAWARAGVQIGYGADDFEEGRDEVFQAPARFTIQLGPHLH